MVNTASENLSKSIETRLMPNFTALLERIIEIQEAVSRLEKRLDEPRGGHARGNGAPNGEERVLNAIRSGGARGVSLTVLARKTQLIDGAVRKEILDGLVASGSIERKYQWENGHLRTMVRMIGDSER